MKKSRIFCAILASVAFFALLFSGTMAFAAKKDKAQTNAGKIKIVATIFPEYDWVLQILGKQAKNAEVTLLLDNGVDLHSFQPSARDIIKVNSADIFIYVGGESDEWVEDALKNSTNKNQRTVNLLEVIGDGAKVEELVEGMEAEDEDDEEDEELDEHVWLSVKNAKILCAAIADSLCEVDSKNAAEYKKNLVDYTKKLDSLDEKFAREISKSDKKTVLFGDRFPFRYLTDDYDLKYYAAFVGCSAETEASFKTVIFLANKLDELNLGSVCTIEKSDRKIASSIIQNSKNKKRSILEIDSMQATTMRDSKKGATYISIMEKNLESLKKALK